MSEQYMFIVTEHVKGKLLDAWLLHHGGSVMEAGARHAFRQIAAAVSHCHHFVSLSTKSNLCSRQPHSLKHGLLASESVQGRLDWAVGG